MSPVNRRRRAREHGESSRWMNSSPPQLDEMADPASPNIIETLSLAINARQELSDEQSGLSQIEDIDSTGSMDHCEEANNLANLVGSNSSGSLFGSREQLRNELMDMEIEKLANEKTVISTDQESLTANVAVDACSNLELAMRFIQVKAEQSDEHAEASANECPLFFNARENVGPNHSGQHFHPLWTLFSIDHGIRL